MMADDSLFAVDDWELGFGASRNLIEAAFSTDGVWPNPQVLESGMAIDSYLFRLRASVMRLLAEGSQPDTELLRLCIAKHVRYSHGHEALRWLDALPESLRQQVVPMEARVHLSLGNVSTALAMLGPLGHKHGEGAFLRGWIFTHLLNDIEQAEYWRVQVSEGDELRAREAVSRFERSGPEVINDFTRPITQRLPLLAGDFRGMSGETIVAGADLLRIALQRARPSREISSGPDVPSVQGLRSEQKEAIAQAGFHVPALELMGLESLFVEVLGDDRQAILERVESMRPLSTMEFFSGWLGYRRNDSHEHLIHTYRWPEEKSAFALCPHTGRARRTQRSAIVVDSDSLSMHYEFEAEGPSPRFILSSFGWRFQRAQVYLSAMDRCVAIRDDQGLHGSRETIARAERRLGRVPRSPSGRRVIVYGFNRNIGHHYHNEASGLFRLAANDLLRDSDVVIAGPYAYYPPSIVASELETLDVRSWESIDRTADELATKGHFVLRPTDVWAPRGLAMAIQSAAKKGCSDEADEVLRKLKPGSLRVVIVLRTSRRVWRSQTQGVPLLVNELRFAAQRNGYAGLTVFFDGYTRTDRYPNETETIELERSFVESMVAAAEGCFRGVQVINCVGMNLLDKARVLSEAQLAVSPKGNGHLPTVAWVANLPSVVHSNSRDLSAVFYECSMREDGVQPLYLDFDSIFDDMKFESVSSLNLARQQGSGYDVNFERLILEVDRLISRVSMAPGSAGFLSL